MDALEGDCPPWVCGALAGAGIEAGVQFISNLSSGDGFLDAISNIDVADVVAAGVEGGITGGGSVVRRLVTKGATMVASEVIQASVDVQMDGTVDVIGTKGSTKSIGQVATETAIGVGSNIVGEAVGSGLEVATTSAAKKQLKTVNRELGRSMKGSRGEATRLTKQAQLNSTIKGNKVVSQGARNITTEVLDEKLKNN